MSASQINDAPNPALQRTAAGRHVTCLRSRRAVPAPSLSLGRWADAPPLDGKRSKTVADGEKNLEYTPNQCNVCMNEAHEHRS
jgi:hypothetical protein